MTTNIIETELDIYIWFQQLNDKINLWITDPPYPFNNKNGTGRFSYKDGNDDMYTRLDWPGLSLVFKEMYDASSEGSRAYIFANKDGLIETINRLKSVGWIHRNILVWDKQHFGGGYHWRNQIEYIVYVSKGKPKVYVKGVGNKFNYKRPTKSSVNLAIGYNPIGASCKPLEIWRDIITYGAADDDVIADPFAGSNPMKAALMMNNNLSNKIKTAYTNALKI